MSLIKKMKKTKRGISLVLSLTMVASLIPNNFSLVNVKAADDTPYVVSAGRPVYASSEIGLATADKVVDGDLGTRWEGKGEGVQWLYVDLGKETDISSIYLKWEAAYAKSYKIQFSNDEENWEDVFIRGNAGSGDGEVVQQDININYTVTDNGISANWNSIDNANYKLLIDNENNIATAPDGYKFSNHAINNGLIKLAEGTYDLIVVAVDKTTGQEICRGTKKVYVTYEEVTTQPEGPTTPAKITDTEATIDVTGKARYVRLYMTERGTNWGYSLYEMQVYGTDGLVKRPADYGENIALNKTVACSSMRDAWWMYVNGVLDQTQVKDTNAVDGNYNTSYTSGESNDQWLYVDLGEVTEIGRVVINWNGDAGKAYDIEVSNDAKTWNTVYRRLNGYAFLKDDVPVYANARYVRVRGYSRVENGSGFGITELEVYKYREGEEKKTYMITELPSTVIVNTTAGSYITNDLYLETAKLPTYIDPENIKLPIASNDWWQSCMIKQFGNTMSTLPFKTGYSRKGLSVLTVTDGWLPTPGPTDVNISVNSEYTPDFYILPENVDTSTAYDRLHKDSDYAAKLQLMDDNGVVMTSTHIKGSPYIFCDFGSREKVYINIPNLTGIYNDNGEEILPVGSTITTDHIGIEVTDTDNKEGTKTSKSLYGFNFPAGTQIKNSNGTLKITFAGDKYMSVAAMLNKSDLYTYYQHGYAFVTDTHVTYEYNDAMSKITTYYEVQTELKRAGFSNTTMHLMLPHQWKYSPQKNNKVAVYPSVRGDMYGIWSNQFTTVDTFEGLLPTFALPTNSEFDQKKVMSYLRTLDSALSNINPAADAYWEGKNLHPLAMGVLMADQLGETELRDSYLERLKARLVDWFTYDGPDDVSYFIYDEHWGTLYYKASEFGANTGICDHHFTYGYFLFGAAVLATYDEEFYHDYKDFVEILMRDYANPEADSEYCKFRAYDLYEGHSWAGGYADNDNGNNQESASESLFSWVGMYLWGILTDDDKWRDAGVFGFANEMEAIEQYWFDYDKQNWIDEWPYECVAQIYGSQNFFGTFFGGQPLYCYGIQWLPISEYLTYYGMNQERAAEIYAGLEKDTQDAKDKAVIVWRNEGKSEEEIEAEYEKYASPDNGWQHITWPFLSQSDPERALEKFVANDTKVQTTDQANTYWFIHAMKEYGYKASDIVATGDLSATVYYNKETNKYTANVWNPTNQEKTVSFMNVNTGNTIGTASIGAKALVKFEVDPNKSFSYTQVAAPKFNATALADGKVTNDISGKVSFDDTQLVEITTATEGTTIHYTTDGSVPSTDSPVYTGKILVSSTSVVKAIAVKAGNIDSAYAAVDVTINGDSTSDSENLALNKNAVASSGIGEGVATNMTDGKTNTRWESTHGSDEEWAYVDLGAEKDINLVKITWEAAAAAEYKIQVSTDANNWTTVANVTNSGAGQKVTEFAAVTARYVRMLGISRVTDYGYSIFEFEVYGAVQAAEPVITPEGGTFTSAQVVTMTTPVKGAEIKYTIDGSEPTEDSPSYVAPFTVSKSTVIKAATYRKGMTLSNVKSASIVIAGTIAISNSTLLVAEGHTKKLTAVSDKAVTWTSSNPAIATVDQNGNVSGIKQGTVTITASVGSDSATCEVTVVEAVPITSVTLNKSEMTIKVKDTALLEATYEPYNTTDDTNVIWASDNTSVATVENGKVVAKMEGTAVISATISGITAKCTVTVEPKFTTLEKFVNEEYNAMLTAKLFQSGKFEGNLSNLQDKIGFFGSAGGNWASQTVTSTSKQAFIIADLEKAYTINQIEAMHIEWKDNDMTLPIGGFKILVCNDENYSTVVDEDGETIITDSSVWTTVFDSSKHQATNAEAGGYDWVKDSVGCYSVIPMVGKYGKAFNHVKIEFSLKNTDMPWGIQAYEIALLTNDEEQQFGSDEDPSEEITTPEEESTEDMVERPKKPSGVVVTSENPNEITFVMGNPLNDQTFNVYIDGEFYDNVGLGAYTIKNVSAGTHTFAITGVLNGYESDAYETTVVVEQGVQSETSTNEEGILVADKLAINGFQISTKSAGVRTVYSMSTEIDGKEVVERGLVYGLEKYSQSKNVVVGSTDSNVYSYAATSIGKITPINDEVEESYVMTMKHNFDASTIEGLTTNYYVRAYAKLSDGTYVYSEIQKYSVYAIANEVYANSGMVDEASHAYLYEKILKKVDATYPEKEYNNPGQYTVVTNH